MPQIYLVRWLVYQENSKTVKREKRKKRIPREVSSYLHFHFLVRPKSFHFPLAFTSLLVTYLFLVLLILILLLLPHLLFFPFCTVATLVKDPWKICKQFYIWDMTVNFRRKSLLRKSRKRPKKSGRGGGGGRGAEKEENEEREGENWKSRVKRKQGNGERQL